MKFSTFAFAINFILVCWPKLDIILVHILETGAIHKSYKLFAKKPDTLLSLN